MEETGEQSEFKLEGRELNANGSLKIFEQKNVYRSSSQAEYIAKHL
jgi:hypothetical protein